jgi:cytochrome oxidase Cu insertion factor (SCO1/SenC/PrrC family)
MGKRKLAKAPSGKEKKQARSRWMTWAIVGGSVVVIGVKKALLVLQSGPKAAPGAGRIEREGRPAPDITLRLFTGQNVTLSSLKGKPVLVNFWHSS